LLTAIGLASARVNAQQPAAGRKPFTGTIDKITFDVSQRQ
jgi:hypothetical protein